MADCIIVGGGIIGLLTARQLFLEGVDVLLLEKGPLGGESSWAGGGIISPLYPWRYAAAVNVLAQRSKAIYPELVETIYNESSVDCELINSGLFTVTQELPEINRWIDQWSINASYITDKADILEIEPVVGDLVNQGLWMPDILQIRNPQLVKALKGSFDHHNIPYEEQTAIEEIIVSENKVVGIKTANKTYHADKVVICSGAWSAQFTQLQNKVDVMPVKGQMIMYKGEPDLVKRIVLSEGHYIIPRRDGRILAGSTLEKIGFDKTVSQQALDDLHQSAIGLVPLLDELPVERQWAGLRPGTEQGIPYISRHDEITGLYIHAGHYRNGIVLGAASAQVMTDVVLQRDTDWCDVCAYDINALH